MPTGQYDGSILSVKVTSSQINLICVSLTKKNETKQKSLTATISNLKTYSCKTLEVIQKSFLKLYFFLQVNRRSVYIHLYIIQMPKFGRGRQDNNYLEVTLNFLKKYPLSCNGRNFRLGGGLIGLTK